MPHSCIEIHRYRSIEYEGNGFLRIGQVSRFASRRRRKDACLVLQGNECLITADVPFHLAELKWPEVSGKVSQFSLASTVV